MIQYRYNILKYETERKRRGSIMKKKKLAATKLAATMVFTSVPVLAATGTKTATLNNAQIRFNGGPVQNIQCYNIDGYNYVRARDITNNLDIWIFDYKSGQTGIMVDSTMAAPTKNPMEKLTQKTARVQMKDAELAYNSMITETDCFLLNGRYYFKLADFAAASDHTLDVSLDLVDVEARDGIADAPFSETFDGISVTWNNDTKVIDVKRTTTDLVKIFNDIRSEAGNPVLTKPTTNDSNTSDDVDNGHTTQNISTPSKDSHLVDPHVREYFQNFETQPPLTSAPKEGEVLANILIDESKGAYLDKEMNNKNYENYTAPYLYVNTYNPFSSIGQCTWYARGRFIETVGIVTLENPFASNPLSDWVKAAKSDKCPDLDGITDPYGIQPRSIAVWDGHAAFVEWVDYDSNGKPETVYFTEANAYHQGDIKEDKYYPDFDGKVQIMQIDKFINRSSFIGYVIAK